MMEKQNETQQNTNKNKSKAISTLLIAITCLSVMIAVLLSMTKNANTSEAVKALVRNYDLTTEENSSNTLIVKDSLFNKLNQSLEAANLQPQIIKYKDYKVVKFNSTEELEKAQTRLQEDGVDIEIDALLDITTSTTVVTSNEIATAEEVTASTPSAATNTLSKYLVENPSTKQVKVAIIDTGIDKENELFQDRIIDTKLNYSTTGEENDITDDNGHGTVIAEIIAKKTENNVKLMPIKVANENGKSTVLSVYMAINEAISQKADIINISMNTFNSQSGLLREAIDKANAKGIKVVVSSGNLGIDVENIAPSNNKLIVKKQLSSY